MRGYPKSGLLVDKVYEGKLISGVIQTTSVRRSIKTCVILQSYKWSVTRHLEGCVTVTAIMLQMVINSRHIQVCFIATLLEVVSDTTCKTCN